MLFPLRQFRVEDGRFGNQHGLVMVGRGQRGLASQGKDQPRAIAAKDLRQGQTGFKRVKQAAIRQIERNSPAVAPNTSAARLASAKRTCRTG